MSDEKNEFPGEGHPIRQLISGGVRSLANFDPTGTCGAIAQAWGEYEGHKQSARVEQFMVSLGQRLEGVEAATGLNTEAISQMPDVAELLEQCVQAAISEFSDQKRGLYSEVYFNFLSRPTETSPDERFNIVMEIEQLTGSDLGLLRRIGEHGAASGDQLTGTTQPKSYAVGGMSRQEENQRLMDTHADLMHGIVKLTSRGLIREVDRVSSFVSFGEADSEMNTFRQTSWRITPMARKLLAALSGSNL